MSYARTFAIAATAAWVLGATPRSAIADASGTTYALITPPSSYQVGCHGPCECAVVSQPTFGSFELIRAGADALYTYYAVDRYIASFNNGPGAVSITGSGQYKIGGEAARVQEMTLDLSIWGSPPVHFDSGLQPVNVPFPQIDISTAVNGLSCYDTVLVVDAKPAGPVDVTPPRSGQSGLQAVRPNPFKGRATIAFSLDRPGPVGLTIVDAVGHRVRVLAAKKFVESGPQTVPWDGRYDDGRVAPAGVYWVRLRWPGGSDSRRFVKLD